MLGARSSIADPFDETHQILGRLLTRVFVAVQFRKEFREELDGLDIDDRATLSRNDVSVTKIFRYKKAKDDVVILILRTNKKMYEL